MKSQTSAECGRKMTEKDSFLSDLDMPLSYLAVLQIMRLFIQSVSHPPSMAWMAALSGADETFDATYGPQIASRTLEALQMVRMSRRSLFHFNSPSCPSCCQIVTEHERRFMRALDNIHNGSTGQARMELIMLCEGNDVAPALDAMERLSQLIQASQLSNTQSFESPDTIERRVN
ncbi:hypothetical protein [Octadecabacter ascidiaceicola]|uniref:Uncharacterized protein n=1 Tax=Octadecabacter ascidiaceicola TaxID=1655543 RepID=A0A238JLT4_9RHOB|nr:hypothetical protein [Octadecabacter ascidiaceicola]SMX30872.1 hypothetical protein OCA8868_00074 [Octadecabacter ascidiaceicola]